MNVSGQLHSLPIYSRLDEICGALKSSPSRFLILTAETGAGKSTAVPIALMKNFPKKIFMLEPRRLAAVNVASRVSQLLGEEVGQSAGYRVFLESKVSAATRLEVMTHAILTRRLQADPSLEDASVVVLDEFHERSMNADLALAFLKEAMQLRGDLFVLIMSATIDAKKIAAFCGTAGQNKNGGKTEMPAAANLGLATDIDSNAKNAAPILEIPGRTFPVDFFYKPGLSVVGAVRFALEQLQKDKSAAPLEPASGVNTSPKSGRSILVFLPGIYEINKALLELRAADIGAEPRVLHSSVSFDEQKKILSPAAPGTTRVILSSAIAETSLTIPDVVCVIDSGLSRVSKMDNSVGATRLATVPESEFSAAQRAGRAGRTQKGFCVRLWSQNDPRAKELLPEILRSDLSELILECAEWGAKNPASLEWLDRPGEGAWSAARDLLKALGCLDADANITSLGRAVLRLGVGPRLGCAAIFGGAEFVLPYSQYKDSPERLQRRFVEQLQKRLAEARPQFAQLNEIPKPFEPLLAGFADRVARRTEQAGVYQFMSGRLAALKDYKGGLGPEWIVAVEADAGTERGAIYSYKILDAEKTERWLLERAQIDDMREMQNGTLAKTRVVRYGKIILSKKALKAEADDFKKALCDSIAKNGFDSLPIDGRTKNFLTKLKFYEQRLAERRLEARERPAGQKALAASFAAGENADSFTEKKFSKEWLCQNAREWLFPFLTENKVTAQEVYDALYYFYDGAAVERNVPGKITLQNGRQAKVLYQDSERVVPTIEIIIQQIFGCFETPKIMGERVLLKLLSPARRPLQITSDLEHFWSGAWPEICKEMKGRYPKHNWDYRVAEKE